MNTTTTLFSLGSICITSNAMAQLDPVAVKTALIRHSQGDWGILVAEDAQANNDALTNGSRLLSAYTDDGVKFWIITEADRSVTTVLLPEDY